MDKYCSKGFQSIKERLCSASILTQPNFDLLFKVECDVSGVGIGEVLTQSKHLLAYFSEKLNGLRLYYSTYDEEFFVKVLKQWNHYLKSKNCVLHSDYKALSYINGQHKLNTRHANWVSIPLIFHFFLLA